MPAKHLIKLYDVRCNLDPPAWSPNVWKTRFVLNFKKLPYTTQWLAYPDIGAILSAAGVPPTRTEKPYYTVPAIVDEVEGRHPVALADSLNIATYLERTYPQPTIFPGGTERVQMTYITAIHEHVFMAMFYMVIPTTTRILTGRDLGYYTASRKGFIGVALEEMFPPHKQEGMWAKLRQGLDQLSALIDSVRMGHRSRWLFSPVDTPSYADFDLGAIFIWFQKAGPEGGWARIRDLNGGKWRRHMDNLQPYMQVL